MRRDSDPEDLTAFLNVASATGVVVMLGVWAVILAIIGVRYALGY